MALPAQVVVFDCDSTLTRIEGVDELARLKGVGDAVAALTSTAMDGRVAIEQIYARRLELIRPDRSALEWLGRRYVHSLVDDAAEVMHALMLLDKDVHIVSGGFRQAVSMIGRALALPDDHVHAVDLYFDDAGAYAGFDSGSPLARSGGKGEVCRSLFRRDVRAVAIGDGVTDLEMQQAGATFIGFGGVARRDLVVEHADHYVDSPSLRAVLPLILTAEEQRQLHIGSARA